MLRESIFNYNNKTVKINFAPKLNEDITTGCFNGDIMHTHNICMCHLFGNFYHFDACILISDKNLSGLYQRDQE